MSPLNIVRTALEKKLDMIAISDHNSAENVLAVQTAAETTGLVVLPAMEITSREEVHILGIFPDLAAALTMQEMIYSKLAESQEEKYYQEQIVANADDEVEGFCRRLLISATPFSVREIVEKIHGCQGAAVGAHIDRAAFGIIQQLGFIPPQVKFDALEVSWRIPFSDVLQRYPEYSQYSFITNSDSHFLSDIGKVRTYYRIQVPCFDELMKAFHRCQGYGIEIK